MQDNALAPQDPNTLQYFIERRNGRKRNYIFDYGKSKICDHPEMKVLARGGNVYRCTECNYAFHLTGAYQQPLHNEVILSMFTIMHFAKEFGKDSLGEVLYRRIGQVDGSAHKPVLPKGMSFMDVLNALEDVDVTSEDGGKAALQELLGDVWERQSVELPEGVDDGDKALTGDRD